METITQLEFDKADIAPAKRMLERAGFDSENSAYTSSSALVGLHALGSADKPRTAHVIKTRECGLLVVQDQEDLGLVDFERAMREAVAE